MKKQRRFFAMLMSVAMLLQLLPAVTPGARAAGIAPGLTGLPEAAFQLLEWGLSSDKTSLTIGFDFELDNGFIEQTAETFLAEFTEAFEEAHDVLPTDAEIDAGLEEPNSLPEITFSIPITLHLQEELAEVMAEIPAEGTLTTAKGEEIGTYTTVYDAATGVLTIEGRLLKRVYNRSDVTGGGSLTLSFELEGGEVIDPEVGEDGNSITISAKADGPVEPEEPEDPVYTLTKAVVSRTDKSYPLISYEIKATAEGDGASVAGLTIRDVIPEGLVLESVTYGGNPLTLGTDYTYGQDRTLAVTLPEGAGAQAAIVVNTSVSEEVYAALLQSPTENAGILSISKTFENTATLHKEGVTDPVAYTDKVTDTFAVKVLEKKGERVANAEGGVYDWTLTAHTPFFNTGSGRVYLVDVIDSNHAYVLNTNGSLPYTIGGAPATATLTTSTLGYDALTVAALDSLTGNAANSVYYRVGTGTAQKTILIIPLTAGGETIVKYQTKVTETANEEQSGFNLKTLTNKAKIVARWNWDGTGGGTGLPGDGGQDFNYGVTKNVEAKYRPLRKAAVSYSTTTHIMNWELQINEWSKNLTDVVITDVLDDAVQQFAGLKIGSVEIPLGAEGAALPYYKLVKDAVQNKTTVEIHLSNINIGQVVKVNLATKVVDPAFLSQHGSKEIKNEATITAKAGGKGFTYTANASRNNTNALLKKEKLSYDYNTHELKWRVTANESFVALYGAELTDYLPAGTSFGTLTRVTRYADPQNPNSNPQTGTIAPGAVTFADGFTITRNPIAEGTTTDSKYSKDTASFTFSGAPTTDKFVFEFTTVVDQNYREDYFTSGTSASFKNEVKLTGKVEHPLYPGDLTKAVAVDKMAEATHAVTPEPLKKTGQYYGKDESTGLPYATWRIVINRDKLDMAGATLTDALLPHFELDTASVQIYAATINASSGAATATGAPITEGLAATDRGFTFTIPQSYGTVPLIITFKTHLVDSAPAADIRNEATLKWGSKTSTGGSGGTQIGAVTFDVDSYATGVKVPFFQVLKTSSNSLGLEAGKPDFRLQGAEFTLTPMKADEDGWTPDADKAVKTRVTSATGNAYFFFLRQDTLYRVEETRAPDGYVPNTAPLYVVFEKNAPVLAYPEGTKVVSFDQTKNAKAIIPNTPTNTEGEDEKYTFSFDKKTDTGTALPGVAFTLRDRAGKLQDKTARSSASGRVTFSEVDAGIYDLLETTPAGFADATGITVTVTWDGSRYTLAMTGDAVSQPQEAGFVVTNAYQRGTAGLIKADETDYERLLSGAEFSVYLPVADGEDQLVGYLVEDVPAEVPENPENPENPQPTLVPAGNPGHYVLSDTNGAGTSAPAVKNTLGDRYLQQHADVWTLLAGDYYLTETKTPTGYLDDRDELGELRKHAFTVAGDGGQVLIANTPETGLFTNAPYGVIQGRKLTGSDTPLANAVIGLFSAETTEFTEANLFAGMTAVSETDGSFRFDKVPYGSYVVAELKAPAGYYLNKQTAYTVNVHQNEAPITIGLIGETEADIVIKNDRIPSSSRDEATLSIQKTAEDGALQGFAFVVRGSKGYYGEFITDANGRITIPYLTLDTYTVEEKDNALTSGRYRLPLGQSVTLTLGGARLNFYNELLPEEPEVPIEDPETPTGDLPQDPQPNLDPNPGDPELELEDPEVPTGGLPNAPDNSGGQIYGPRTGDSSLYALWQALAVLSALGVGFSATMLYRDGRRRKRG